MHKMVKIIGGLLLVAAALFGGSVALAQFNGCPAGFCNKVGGSGPPPVVGACGTIDLSNGCAQPMLR